MTARAYVVLGDVVGSRELPDRESFRETIEAAIEAANDRYGPTMAAPFAIVKGVDEVAGVLAEPRDLYRLLRDLVGAVRPGAIRFAIAYGEIDVGAAGDDVRAMDGPAFHRADAAFDDFAGTDLYVRFDGRVPAFDPLVGAAVNLLLMAREGWTDRQRAMVRAYDSAGTQTAVAEEFGVSQQTVSATLRRADWPRLVQLESAVNGTLARYDDAAAGGESGDGGR